MLYQHHLDYGPSSTVAPFRSSHPCMSMHLIHPSLPGTFLGWWPSQTLLQLPLSALLMVVFWRQHLTEIDMTQHTYFLQIPCHFLMSQLLSNFSWGFILVVSSNNHSRIKLDAVILQLFYSYIQY